MALKEIVLGAALVFGVAGCNQEDKTLQVDKFLNSFNCSETGQSVQKKPFFITKDEPDGGVLNLYCTCTNHEDVSATVIKQRSFANGNFSREGMDLFDIKKDGSVDYIRRWYTGAYWIYDRNDEHLLFKLVVDPEFRKLKKLEKEYKE